MNSFNKLDQTKDFLLSDSLFAKTFHGINLQALNEAKDWFSNPSGMLDDVDRGVAAMNFHMDTLAASVDPELQETSSFAIAEMMLQRPLVLRWMITFLICENQTKRAEELMNIVRELYFTQGEDIGELWRGIEDTYSEEEAVTLDQVLHGFFIQALQDKN